MSHMHCTEVVKMNPHSGTWVSSVKLVFNLSFTRPSFQSYRPTYDSLTGRLSITVLTGSNIGWLLV